MRLSTIELGCGARLCMEQDDGGFGLYGGSVMLGLYGSGYGPGGYGPVRCWLERLQVTMAEAQALIDLDRPQYGSGLTWYHSSRRGPGMEVSGLELTAAEANAIADGADPLTVLGIYPGRVVLAIVRRPWDD